MNTAIGHCGLYIKMLNDLIVREANSQLQAHNLTVSQARMLTVLHTAPGGECALKELESHLRVAQPTIAGLASRLEKKGLIISVSDPDDRRVKRIRLTDAGRQLCLSAGEHIAHYEKQLTAGLTDEEQRLFVSLLARVYQNARRSSNGKDECLCSKP